MIGATTAPIRAQASTSAFTCHQVGSWTATTCPGRTPNSYSAPANRSTCSAYSR